MGLKDLYSLLHDRKEVPHGVSYPKIIKEIRKFKESKTDKNPIILIHFPSLIYTTKATTVEVLRGRRFGEILEELKSFFDALIVEDMELVFFSEGYQIVKDESKWLSHKTKHYMEECQIIEDIEKGADRFNSKHKPFNQGSALRSFLEQNLKSYGKWIKVFDMDVNLETGRYAKDNKVFAVFNDEIEFLIYPGNYRLWRIRNIRFEDISTKEINKFNFRKALGLFPEHMPLFATLCGNDIISNEKLKTFHKGFPEKARIKGIAKYVIKVKGRDEDVDIEKVSKRIGCSKEEIEASLEKYDLINNRVPSERAEENLMQKLRDNGNSHVYALLKMQPLRLGPYFEDLRSPILDAHQLDLCLQLHRCLLGIVFKEKNDPSLKYPLYTIKDHETGYECIQETPAYPPFDIPPFEKLMFGHENGEFAAFRFKLLKWSLKCDKLSSLDGVPDVFVPVVLTLNFIVQEAKLKTDDADVLLLSFFDTIYDRVPILSETEQTLELYPFQLSYYYLRVQSLVIRIMSTIGLVKWSQFPEFNGVYFHHLYKMWNSLDEYAKNDRLNEIKNIRLYAA